MKIALVSDVHSNLHALEAVLGHMQERGVDRFYCLGDIVGYNAFPSECTGLVRQRADTTILGNHDWAATVGSAEGFNPVAKFAIEHTRKSITESDVKYISSLEPSAKVLLHRMSIDLYHGSPFDPLHEYIFPSMAHALFENLARRLPDDRPRVVALGHTHVPLALSSHAIDSHALGEILPMLVEADLAPERRHPLLLVNPGSVGQPRDGDPRAAYAILDAAAATVRYERVEYDVSAAQKAIREAGLPELLASRLALGR